MSIDMPFTVMVILSPLTDCTTVRALPMTSSLSVLFCLSGKFKTLSEVNSKSIPMKLMLPLPEERVPLNLSIFSAPPWAAMALRTISLASSWAAERPATPTSRPRDRAGSSSRRMGLLREGFQAPWLDYLAASAEATGPLRVDTTWQSGYPWRTGAEVTDATDRPGHPGRSARPVGPIRRRGRRHRGVAVDPRLALASLLGRARDNCWRRARRAQYATG